MRSNQMTIAHPQFLAGGPGTAIENVLLQQRNETQYQAGALGPEIVSDLSELFRRTAAD
ncbi:hypothetical protein Srut_39750 [Streptomyces rutgersensis]|nr:hypothetical protein Srut_39750 [Streptomyces rutgersensis]